ncbi:MAG: hypothetical protein ACF8LK_06310, partial [Phycisphaerales bacterium JB041]
MLLITGVATQADPDRLRQTSESDFRAALEESDLRSRLQIDALNEVVAEFRTYQRNEMQYAHDARAQLLRIAEDTASGVGALRKSVDDLRGAIDKLMHTLRHHYVEKVSEVISSPQTRSQRASATPHGQSELSAKTQAARAAFLGHCEHIASSPGTFFFSGEKIGVDGGCATLQHVPRRVYVGLQTVEGKNELIPARTCALHVRPEHDNQYARQQSQRLTYGKIDPATYSVLASWLHSQGGDFPSQRIYAWTEWPGESGLGWSAAYSCALAGALSSLFHKPLRTPLRSLLCPEAKELLTLAWLCESMIHGGRAQGSSVTASMMTSPLPIAFRTGSGVADHVPRLYRFPSTDDPATPTREEFLADMAPMLDRFK